jgi:hypothetical protein
MGKQMSALRKFSKHVHLELFLVVKGIKIDLFFYELFLAILINQFFNCGKIANDLIGY